MYSKQLAAQLWEDSPHVAEGELIYRFGWAIQLFASLGQQWRSARMLTVSSLLGMCSRNAIQAALHASGTASLATLLSVFSNNCWSAGVLCEGRVLSNTWTVERDMT